MRETGPRIVALTGGIGGAKLCVGLTRVARPEQLTFIVNTGDDFEHYGLHIAPDVDTLTYTLAGLNNPDSGWGRNDESWQCMQSLAELDAPTWFNLGDRDLGLHLVRTDALRRGESLSDVIAHVAHAHGVSGRILPMSDDAVRTTVLTERGALDFQHYFVRDRAQPSVTGFEFRGADTARPAPGVLEAIHEADAIVMCPSNPFVSIDPILAVPGIGRALRSATAPVVAVSPIVGGIAIKGPTAKMMQELNVPATARQVAEHYGNLLNGFVLDAADAELHGTLTVPTCVTDTVMHSLEDRVRVADATLAFCARLSGT